MAFRILALLCSTVGVTAVREADQVTPIEKVVDLLKKLSTQIGEEGAREAAEYDKYACFCKEQADEKNYAVETSETKIGVLKAKEAELTADISALNQDISDLTTKVGDLEKDIKTAVDKRKVESDTYQKQSQDVADAISAVERAVEAMKDSKENIDGKVDLAQLSASSPLLAAALLAQVSDKQNPAAYQYSSNDILATLDGLLTKFKVKKQELFEADFAAKGSFELKRQDMNNQKTFAEKEKFEKEEQVESLGETLADTKEENADETKAHDADEEFIKVLSTECEQKAKDFDQRSSTRSSEITAITEAVTDLEKNAMGKFLQVKVAPSFLQLRGKPSKTSLLAEASGTSRIAATQRVLDLLMKKTDKSDSPVLASIAMKLTLLQQSGVDHFVKVRQIIKDLLVKLDADAKSEATTKTYCDKNLKKQTDNRDSAKLTIEAKAAGISSSNAELAETKQAIAELTAGIAQNMKGLNEATELRAEAKATNDASLKISDAGKKSVEYALTVLKAFYSKALIQKDAYTPPKADRSGKTVGDLAPETFSGSYHGNQDANKGIVGILEVIQADFERTSKQVTADDKESESAFQLVKKTTEEDNVAKNKELKLKEKKETDLKDKLVTLKDDKLGAEKSLASAESTLDDLKKMCIEGEETYKERKAKREEEIDALKEALSILENWKD